MAMTPYNFLIDSADLAALEAIKTKAGVPVSESIRRAIKHHLIRVGNGTLKHTSKQPR